MIYSAFEDNWNSVITINGIAQSKYWESENSPMKRELRPLLDCPFDAYAFDLRRQESQLVNIAIVWSILTIESLANHIVASVVCDTADAILAIEKPKLAIKKRFEESKSQSDLAVKFEILNNGKRIDSISNLADRLSFIRNSIIHDKPFELVSNHDGNVEITNFLTKGEKQRYCYPDLEQFYADCSTLVQALHMTNLVSRLDCDVIKFETLYSITA